MTIAKVAEKGQLRVLARRRSVPGHHSYLPKILLECTCHPQLPRYDYIMAGPADVFEIKLHLEHEQVCKAEKLDMGAAGKWCAIKA